MTGCKTAPKPEPRGSQAIRYRIPEMYSDHSVWREAVDVSLACDKDLESNAERQRSRCPARSSRGRDRARGVRQTLHCGSHVRFPPPPLSFMVVAYCTSLTPPCGIYPRPCERAVRIDVRYRYVWTPQNGSFRKRIFLKTYIRVHVALEIASVFTCTESHSRVPTPQQQYFLFDFRMSSQASFLGQASEGFNHYFRATPPPPPLSLSLSLLSQQRKIA